VYPERMRRNLELTRAWFFPASCCWIWRPRACYASRLPYRAGPRHARLGGRVDFRAAIEADPEIRAVLRPQQIDKAFSLERQLRNIHKIFARVSGGKRRSKAKFHGLRAAAQNSPFVRPKRPAGGPTRDKDSLSSSQ